MLPPLRFLLVLDCHQACDCILIGSDATRNNLVNPKPRICELPWTADQTHDGAVYIVLEWI